MQPRQLLFVSRIVLEGAGEEARTETLLIDERSCRGYCGVAALSEQDLGLAESSSCRLALLDPYRKL